MNSFLKRISPKKVIMLFIICFCVSSYAKADSRYYYQIKVYHLKTTAQEERMDRYLQNAYLPAMHKMGVKNIGIFKPIAVDTSDRKIYVFIRLKIWMNWKARRVNY